MSGELTIRPAHSEDAAAILAYLRQIGAESDNLTFGPEGLPITEEQERQYLRQVENDPDALMLVAQEADEIVALCGLSRPRRPRMSHRAQIDASVRKSHWNHGIATRMLAELLETGVRAYRRMRAGVRKSEKWRFDLQRALRGLGDTAAIP